MIWAVRYIDDACRGTTDEIFGVFSHVKRDGRAFSGRAEWPPARVEACAGKRFYGLISIMDYALVYFYETKARTLEEFIQEYPEIFL